MKDEIRSMGHSHLSVETSLDALADLLRESQERGKMTSKNHGALQRHTRLLLQRFSEHLQDAEGVAHLSKRVLGAKPGVMQTLDEHTTELCQALQEFAIHVDEVSAGVSTDAPTWERMRKSFYNLMEQFETCSDDERSFFSQYATLLSPGGASAQ